MIHFVGAGPGAPDLITIRGQKLLAKADVIIYAGSLVNPALLEVKKPECAVYNSAHMTLEEVLDVMKKAEQSGKTTVRLHTGDPSLYGAIREQMDALKKMNIAYDICPGVSAFCGTASALELEYTLPGVSQTVIISRTAGRTPVPEAGIYSSAGKTSGNDGPFPEYRPFAETSERADRRRLYSGYTGCNLL